MVYIYKCLLSCIHVCAIVQVLLLKESCPSAVQYNSSLTKVPEIDEELAKVAV